MQVVPTHPNKVISSIPTTGNIAMFNLMQFQVPSVTKDNYDS